MIEVFDRLRAIPFAALFAAVLMCAPVAAQEYQVTGVEPGDTLNFRAVDDHAGPPHGAPLVFSLPGGSTVLSTGRSRVIEGGVWREVVHQGARAWANERYLTRSGYIPEKAQFQCGGTEPFWDIEIGTESALFRTPEDQNGLELGVKGPRPGVARPNFWTYHFEPRSGADKRLTGLLIVDDLCSDGMSDYNYSFTFYLLDPVDGPDAPPASWHGCCSLK